MDIFFVVLFLIFCLIGFFRGGIKMSQSLLSTMLSVFIAFMLYKNLALVLFDIRGVGVSIEGWIKNIIDEKVPNVFLSRQEVDGYLNATPIGKVFLNILGNNLNGLQFKDGLSLGQMFSESVAMMIVQIVSFVLTYLCLKITLKTFFVFIGKIFRKNLPLKVFDRIVGIIIGGGKGFLLFFMCCMIIVKVSALTLNDGLLDFVASSKVVGFVFGGIEGGLL